MQFITHLQGDPHSSLTPLFLIHAVSGLSSPYLRLGRLGDEYSYIDGERMVYGIASPIYGSRSFKASATLQELANRYVDAIRAKQPHGPYLLGGWSMGGMLAIKMADILLQHGEQVLKVIMIDSANPETLPHMELDEQRVMGNEIFRRNLGFTKSSPSSVHLTLKPAAIPKWRCKSGQAIAICKRYALISPWVRLMSTVPAGELLVGLSG